MNRPHFQSELNRLISNFKNQNYPDERKAAIWKQVKDFSDGWFTQLITELIVYAGNYLPTMAEIEEHIARERERQNAIDKRNRWYDLGPDPRDDPKSTEARKEVLAYINQILKRM